MHTHMPWATTISIPRYDFGHVCEDFFIVIPLYWKGVYFELGLCTSNHPTSLAGFIMVNVIETGFCQMLNNLTIIPISPL